MPVDQRVDLETEQTSPRAWSSEVTVTIQTDVHGGKRTTMDDTRVSLVFHLHPRCAPCII